MKYYPALLDIRDRLCLVIGKGPLAKDKVNLLKQAGAEVYQSDHFEPEKARNCFLIVAVLENPEQGRYIREFGDRHRIFVNVVDQTENCSFIAPAIVKRGDLIIAVSTSGKSPALASRIRQDLEKHFNDEYSVLIDALGEIRPQVKKVLPDFEDRKRFYTNLVQHDLIKILQHKGLTALKAEIQECLKGEST